VALEKVVAMQTRDTARLYGWTIAACSAGHEGGRQHHRSRGLTIHAPQMVFDLPANGRRMIQKAGGYRATIVSGVVTFENAKPPARCPAS